MPNKATSKSQFRLLKGIAEGSISERGSLTKEKATEMLGSQTPYGLPEKAKKEALGRLVDKVKKARTGKRFKIG
jgi:hypothetical protein